MVGAGSAFDRPCRSMGGERASGSLALPCADKRLAPCGWTDSHARRRCCGEAHGYESPLAPARQPSAHKFGAGGNSRYYRGSWPRCSTVGVIAKRPRDWLWQFYIAIKEPVRHWPFYCGERSAIICLVLGPEKSTTYSSEYVSGFSGPSARNWLHLLRLVTRVMSDRLLEDRSRIVKPFAMEGLFDWVMQDVRLRASVCCV